MIPTARRLALALCALALPLLAPQAASAQSMVQACYNPAGLLYIIGVEGQPDECRGSDTAVSWYSSTAAEVSFAAETQQIRAPDEVSPLLSTSFETTRAGTAVIQFYGNVAQSFGASGSGGVSFRIVVDGNQISALVPRHDFESDNRDAQVVTFSWPVELEPGSHTVEIHWRGLKATTDQSPTMDSRSLIVRHPG